MLYPINDYNLFKGTFRQKFYTILDEFPDFKYFLHEVFVEGTAYVVGGFLRDLANHKEPRDLDIILKISSGMIADLLSSSHLNYKLNRFGGAKIYFDNFQVDLWSIENNWSFKNKLVKINEQYIVDNIAVGCFYNFDSLVINVHSLELCTKFYNECIANRTLDILQKNDNYKKLNPTIEANILRAFYLHEKFGLQYSANCKDYLIRRLLFLMDNHNSILNQLIKIREQYSKYAQELTDEVLENNINSLINKNSRISLFRMP